MKANARVGATHNSKKPAGQGASLMIQRASVHSSVEAWQPMQAQREPFPLSQSPLVFWWAVRQAMLLVPIGDATVGVSIEVTALGLMRFVDGHVCNLTDKTTRNMLNGKHTRPCGAPHTTHTRTRTHTRTAHTGRHTRAHGHTQPHTDTHSHTRTHRHADTPWMTSKSGCATAGRAARHRGCSQTGTPTAATWS